MKYSFSFKVTLLSFLMFVTPLVSADQKLASQEQIKAQQLFTSFINTSLYDVTIVYEFCATSGLEDNQFKCEDKEVFVQRKHARYLSENIIPGSKTKLKVLTVNERRADDDCRAQIDPATDSSLGYDTSVVWSPTPSHELLCSVKLK